MLRRQDGGVDVDRYAAVCHRAITDVRGVFDESLKFQHDAETTYRAFVNASPGAIQRSMVGSRLTKDLVTAVLNKTGYAVKFMRMGSHGFLPSGFISWLFVSLGNKEMTILYSPDRIRERLESLSPVQGTHNDAWISFEQDKVLSKVFLHECGHGVLHLDEFWKSARQGKQNRIRLAPEHEQEAWLYASVVWGILVGDYSRDMRGTPAGSDLGWMLA